MIPSEGRIPPQDILDFVGDGCSEIEQVYDEEKGEYKKELVINPKQIHYMSGNVDSNQYGAFVDESEVFLAKAQNCRYKMSRPMADTLAQEIISIFNCWDFGMVAKSSESRRDRNNAKMNFIDKMLKNRKESIVTLKDDAKKAAWLGMTGENKDREE